MRARTRHPFAVYGAAACLAGGLAGPVSAQQQAKPVTITAGIDVRHDDNVARASAARAALRGVRQGDQSVSPNVSVVVLKPLGRHQVSLDGTLAYDFYRRNSFLNRERIGVTGSGLLQVSRCAITVSPAFSRRQSDLGEIAIPRGGGRDSVRNVQTTQVYGGTVECGGDIGLRPIAGIERTIQDNSTDFRQFSDNRRTNYVAGLGYARPTFGKLQILLGIDDVTYPNRPPIGDEEDGFTARQGGVRFQREIGANLQATAQVNYMTLRPRRADAPDFKGVTYDLSLLATLADRLQIEAALSRSAQPALQSDASYRVERQWAVSGTYALSSLLSLNADATFVKRRYAGERPTFGPLLGDDRRDTYAAGATYEFSPRLQFAANVRYQTREAGDPFYSFNSLSEVVSVKFVY